MFWKCHKCHLKTRCNAHKYWLDNTEQVLGLHKIHCDPSNQMPAHCCLTALTWNMVTPLITDDKQYKRINKLLRSKNGTVQAEKKEKQNIKCPKYSFKYNRNYLAFKLFTPWISPWYIFIFPTNGRRFNTYIITTPTCFGPICVYAAKTRPTNTGTQSKYWTSVRDDCTYSHKTLRSRRHEPTSVLYLHNTAVHNNFVNLQHFNISYQRSVANIYEPYDHWILDDGDDYNPMKMMQIAPKHVGVTVL